MKFNPENKFFQVITTVSQFVLLNALYLISCLPIITIGAATSSLFQVLLPYAEDERGYLIRPYFKAFITNFKRATLLYLMIAIPILLLSYSMMFWFSMQTILSAVVGVTALFITLYFGAVLLLGLALIGRFDNSLSQTLKNAFFLPLVDPLRSLGVLLIVITIFCLTVILPGFRLFLPLFGFSLTFYCCTFMLLALFKRWSH